MKLRIGVLSLMCFVFGFCGSQGDKTPTEQIVGVYTVESAFEVPDVSSGKILGSGKIRDTIFVKLKQEGFEITNNKWQLNSFDIEGWKNLENSQNKPMAVYGVKYDPTDSTLNSEPLGFMPSLYVDLKNKRLYKGKDRTRGYIKVE